MKLPELKKKFKNKFVIRIVAGVLVVAMAGTGASVYSVQAAKGAETETTAEAAVEDTKDEKDAKDEKDSEDGLKDALESSIKINEKEIGKEETVYIISDAAGNAKQTIVSDHLINRDNKASIEDVSSLKDIVNVKGDETFTQNGDKLTWQAEGADIFYQGTATKEAPVTQKITYYLDGKEIAPEELAGKSGKVTMRFDYFNNEKVETKINGKMEEVCVPFMAVSGMVLDDSFSNIEVTNGKVIADGKKNMVIGYTLPGLKESLNVDDEDFDSEIRIPDYFEVTADVENFELGMTMTAAVNATNFISAERGDSESSISEMLDTLTDATSQLQDGSSALADGMDTLQSNLGEFAEGVNTLKDGIKSYTEGAAQLSDGIGTLKKGVGSLTDNVPALTDGVKQLKDGSTAAATGATALKTGADQLTAGAATLSDGVNTLVTEVGGMGATLDTAKAGVQMQFEAQAEMPYEQAKAAIGQLQQAQADLLNGIVAAVAYESAGDATTAAGYYQAMGVADKTQAIAKLQGVNTQLNTLQAGVSQVEGAAAALDGVKAQVATPEMAAKLNALKEGAASLAGNLNTFAAKTGELSTGLNTLDAGLGQLNDKTGTLADGAKQLSDGTKQLSDGATKLTANSAALNEGAAKLKDGTGAIVDGVGQLSDGAHELADGIVTFNEEGIEKILNSYNGDIEPLMERIQAVLDAGADYQTYTGIADGINGSVKFVYKTDAIKVEK